MFSRLKRWLYVVELESVEPKTEEKTVKEFFEALLSAARDCVAKANHNQTSSPELPALRVFYRQDIIGLQTLSKGRNFTNVVALKRKTGWPRHRENREFGSYFFQTGKTQGILL